jgi:hypothetical protein
LCKLFFLELIWISHFVACRTPFWYRLVQFAPMAFNSDLLVLVLVFREFFCFFWSEFEIM